MTTWNMYKPVHDTVNKYMLNEYAVLETCTTPC